MRVLQELSATVVLFLFMVTIINFQDSESRFTHRQQFKGSMLNPPSLRLRILLKSEKMQIHGQPVFDVFAKPIVSTDRSSIRYDGFATFVEGDLEFMYMVVDGVAYSVKSAVGENGSYSTQTARSLTSITPFDSIVEALNNLTAISTGSVGDEVGCSSGTLYETSFGGQNFVVCGMETEGFVAYGEDLIVTVEYLDSPLKNISVPALTSTNTSCAVLMTATLVTPTTLTLLTGSTASTCPSLESC